MDDRSADDLFMSAVLLSSEFEKVFSVDCFDFDRGCNESIICTKRKNNPVCRHTRKDHERSIALWNSLRMCISKSFTDLFNL